MAIKVGKKFKCMFCTETFSRSLDCDIHRDKTHNIIYVPFLPEDLERLRKFLYFKDDALLTPTLSTTISTYARNSAKIKMTQQHDE